MTTLERCRCQELEGELRHALEEGRRERERLRKEVSTLWSTLLRVALATPPPQR